MAASDSRRGRADGRSRSRDGRTRRSTRPSPRGVKTRQKILAVAEEVFAERGYEGTTFSAIADRLGIQQPGIFYHFPDKPTLYRSVLEEAMSSSHSPLSAYREDLPARDRILLSVDRWVDSITRRPTLAKLILEAFARSGVRHDLNTLMHSRGNHLHAEITRALTECAGAPVDPRDALHFISSFMGTTLCYLVVAPDVTGQSDSVQTVHQDSIDRHRALLKTTTDVIIAEVTKRARESAATSEPSRRASPRSRRRASSRR